METAHDAGVITNEEFAIFQNAGYMGLYGGPDMFVNVTDVLTPVDTITDMNNFTGTDLASINMNNVMGAGIVDFKIMFVNASSNTVEVPVPANVVANSLCNRENVGCNCRNIKIKIWDEYYKVRNSIRLINVNSSWSR